MYNSVCEAARALLDKLPMNYEFTMKEWIDMIKRFYPAAKYKCHTTLDRRLRQCRSGRGYFIDCINSSRSLYKKVEVKVNKKTA